MTLKISVISRSGESNTDLIEEQIEGLDYELEKFACASEGETIEAMTGADIVIDAGVPLPREVIEETEGVQAILVGSHGFNHIDHEAATDQGIMLVNAAGFCTEEVSNHAIMLLLACAKKLTHLNDLVKSGRWEESRSVVLPMVPIFEQTLGSGGVWEYRARDGPQGAGVRDRRHRVRSVLPAVDSDGVPNSTGRKP